MSQNHERDELRRIIRQTGSLGAPTGPSAGSAPRISDRWDPAEYRAALEAAQNDSSGHAYERLPSTDKRSLCRHCLKTWDDPIHRTEDK